MSVQSDRPYLVAGGPSDQAEKSTVNPNASKVQDRILIELQLLSFLFHQASGSNEDLAKMRADVAASIT